MNPFIFGSELERKYHIRFFSFAFMIGDSLSQDRMCGHYLAYANIPRLCCAYNVTPQESEDPSHACNFSYMNHINEKCIRSNENFP